MKQETFKKAQAVRHRIRDLKEKISDIKLTQAIEFRQEEDFFHILTDSPDFQAVKDFLLSRWEKELEEKQKIFDEL